jgi:hypothetical protein
MRKKITRHLSSAARIPSTCAEDSGRVRSTPPISAPMCAESGLTVNSASFSMAAAFISNSFVRGIH